MAGNLQIGTLSADRARLQGVLALSADDTKATSMICKLRRCIICKLCKGYLHNLKITQKSAALSLLHQFPLPSLICPFPSPHSPPAFRFLTPMPSEAALGTNTTFFCKGIGSVDFRITWQRNGIQFDSNELSSDGIVYDITRGGRLESSLLTVLASPGNDGASFTCVLVIPNITAFLSDPARITVRSKSGS